MAQVCTALLTVTSSQSLAQTLVYQPSSSYAFATAGTAHDHDSDSGTNGAAATAYNPLPIDSFAEVRVGAPDYVDPGFNKAGCMFWGDFFPAEDQYQNILRCGGSGYVESSYSISSSSLPVGTPVTIHVEFLGFVTGDTSNFGEAIVHGLVQTDTTGYSVYVECLDGSYFVSDPNHNLSGSGMPEPFGFVADFEAEVGQTVKVSLDSFGLTGMGNSEVVVVRPRLFITVYP